MAVNAKTANFFQIEYFVALLRNMFIIPECTQSISLTQQCENELALYKRLEEKESIVAFLQESVQFCRLVSEAIPVIKTLLMSKQAGDVSEAIDFFTTAHHFNIDAAKLGVANMLLLVWSPDQVSLNHTNIINTKVKMYGWHRCLLPLHAKATERNRLKLSINVGQA